jgi:amino acid transporter
MKAKFESLLTSFLWISFIIIAFALVIGGFLFIFDLINGKVTLTIFVERSFDSVLLIGYALVMHNLLKISNSLSKTPFIRENVKYFKKIGYIFFILAIVDAFYSSIYFPNEGIGEILGLNITIMLISLAILSLTFLVIADVFEKAIMIKEDNDLTI